MSYDAVTCGFARQQGASQRPVINRDDQFRPSVFIYGGHGLDGRSRGYVAAPCNNREGVKKWCAQTKRPASSPGSRATQTAGPKAQGTSRMVNVWQHDERRCTRALRLEGRRTSCHSFACAVPVARFAQPLHIDCERGDRATSARSRRLAPPRSGQSAADSRPVC